MTDAKEYDYIFYTFICNDPNITDCYVGSTKAFRERKSTHKSHCNNETSKKHNLKIYQTIRANGGWDNWNMKPIDTKFCTTLEAHIHETKLMEERQSTLNIYKAYLSEEEFKKQRKEQRKEYYEQNKDAINARSKEYYEQNRDAICAKKKEYNEQNKDAINAKTREYREKNKDKINARYRELYALKKGQEPL